MIINKSFKLGFKRIVLGEQIVSKNTSFYFYVYLFNRQLVQHIILVNVEPFSHCEPPRESWRLNSLRKR
ncbi:hypothetical protein AML51_01190 [Escherichia coli]|nr:hypothetical protein AML51_01190 [Escherichia coli]KYW53400.1 hypothetical protein AMK96_02170 [Escherichia coli]